MQTMRTVAPPRFLANGRVRSCAHWASKKSVLTFERLRLISLDIVDAHGLRVRMMAHPAHKGVLVGYARTSTAEQEAGLHAQVRDLQAAGCAELERALD